MTKMNHNQKIIETEGYEIHIDDYLMFEWYANQMNITIDYLLDEFSMGTQLMLPDGIVDYDYENATYTIMKVPPNSN
jgi:hypothetical protein